MKIDNRIDNDILERVELHFTVEHPKSPTPSLRELIEMVNRMEPGSVKSQIYIMKVISRFGRSSTTGVAHIYANEEAAHATVPTFVKDRHVRRGAHAAPAPEEPVESDDESESSAEEEKSEDSDADEEGS
jgi:ribosomal protein S24E